MGKSCHSELCRSKTELIPFTSRFLQNIDTDTQWAYWDGVRKFESKNRDYLQVRCLLTCNPDMVSAP
jgi:hypothetical protein